MLREAGVRQIADILRLVPGMVVGSRSPAVQPATYLGLSDDLSRRVQVLVDGFSIYTPSTGAVFWQDMPVTVDEIERIEVVRGPNTAAYGSQSLLATIKITTMAPRETSSWGASGTLGSNGVRDAHARVATGNAQGAVMLSYAHQEDEGMSAQTYSRGAHRRDTLNLKGEHDLAPGLDVQWQLGVAQARNGIDADVENDISATINDAFRDDSDHQFLVFHHRPASGDEWVLRLARIAQAYAEPDATRYELIFLPGQPLPTSLSDAQPLKLGRSFNTTSHELELEHHLEPLQDVRAVWGLGFRREEVDGDQFFGTPGTQRQDFARLFGHVEWRITSDWLLNGGAMIESSSISDPLLTPRLALIHHLAPGHTLRASWNTGTRQPLLFENQGTTAAWAANGSPVWLTRASGAASGGLEAERATEWSLGYFWEPRRDVRFDLRAFHLRVDDLIRALIRPHGADAAIWYPFSPSFIDQGLSAVLDMRNGETVTVRGLEAQLDARVARGTKLNINYALTYAKDEQPASLGWPNYADTVPRQTAGMLLTQRLGGGWDASLKLTYTSAMKWGFFTREALDDYATVGLRIGYTSPMGAHQRLRVDLVGENLNGTVHDFEPDRGWGRTIWLRLGMDAI